MDEETQDNVRRKKKETVMQIVKLKFDGSAVEPLSDSARGAITGYLKPEYYELKIDDDGRITNAAELPDGLIQRAREKLAGPRVRECEHQLQ